MIKWTVVTLLLLLVSVGACASEPEWPQVCLAKDQDIRSSAEHRALMAEYGITCASLYYNLMAKDNLEDPFGWIEREYINLGYEVIVTLVFTDSRQNEAGSENLPLRIFNGEFDEELSELIKAIKRVDHPIVLRPMHEINGDWRPWQMYYRGNDTSVAVSAFGRVAHQFRKAEAPVTIEVNFNRKDGGPLYQVLGEAESYLPILNGIVDQYAISTYNRCGINDTYTEERSFSDDFRPVYERLREFTNKPINVAETSTSGLCGPKIPWFEVMLADIDTEFTGVEQLTFFFGKLKPGQSNSEVYMSWGIESQDERKQFRDLLPQSQPLRQVEPAPQPEQARRDTSNRNYRLPWNIYGQYNHMVKETKNPALNPVTDEEFGEAENVFRLNLTQRILFDAGDGIEWGPGLLVQTVQSTNENMWWNNHVSAGLSFGIYRDIRRTGPIDWGTLSAEVIAERRQYTVDVPDRFKGDGENRVIFRLGVNFGGDWAQ